VTVPDEVRMIHGDDILQWLYHPDGVGTEPTNSPVTTALALCSARQSPKKRKNKLNIKYMKILIIGAGNMGLTYAKGFLRSHIVNKEGIMILEKSVDKEESLRDLGFENIYFTPGEYIKNADLVILAVKPQNTQELFESIKEYIGSDQVVLSIMAGVKMSTISECLGVNKIIRAMPNLASQIGQSMTVFTSTDDVTRIELVMVQNLINTTGKSIYTGEENMLDAATAISGSGPAYVLFFMDALYEAAKDMGFAPSEAGLLVTQTFKGTIDLYNRSNHSAKEWIQKVASKGGTTEAALNSFESCGLQENIKEGAISALKRAIELSEVK